MRDGRIDGESKRERESKDPNVTLYIKDMKMRVCGKCGRDSDEAS